MEYDSPAGAGRAQTPKPRARLHGRVMKACDRCRRHKSRCDDFRPCSICLRAGVECAASTGEGSEQERRPQKQVLTVGEESGEKRRRTKSSLSNQEAGRGRNDHLRTPGSRSRSRSLTWRNETSHQPDTSHLGESEPGEAPSPNAQRDPESEEAEADGRAGQSMIGLTREIFQLSSQSLDHIATSALPDGGPQPQPGDATLAPLGSERLPISSVLGWQLPPEPTMRVLLEDYFVSVHWFSLVILEPKFRAQFESIRDGYASPEQKPFLVLLSVVLALASWYCSKRSSPESDEPEVPWSEWASSLTRHVESQMFEIMDGNTVEHIQAVLLLGSYHCYHGKPKAAFALLGAVIKTAQAIGLHREPTKGTADDIEERKRTWWTIYTWDRWSSITYGRPFGIDDKDCTIAMPRDFYENRRFAAAHQEELVCYSAYQRELNRLYVTASPMLKSIFSTRSSASRSGRHTSEAWNLSLMGQTHQNLKQWRASLPGHLVFDFGQDIELHSSAAVRAHRLQALSLQLTYDHLIVFFHRSLLAKQLQNLSQREGPEHSVSPSQSSPAFSTDTARLENQSPSQAPSSPEEWWEAALRTARVTQSPYTAQLATDGHLVAFLGINLLNAAVVLVICALTNPLTDRAQEAKRNITRVARLQEVLGKRSQLALQSSVVLRSMIYMIVQKEAEAMLASVGATVESGGEPANMPQAHQLSYSVEDALRLPLTLPGDGTIDVGPENTSLLEPYADEGRRLTESLATVQRVFVENELAQMPPAGPSATQFGRVMDNVGGQTLHQHQQPYLDRGFSNIGVEDDLFWMWNSLDGAPLFQLQ